MLGVSARSRPAGRSFSIRFSTRLIDESQKMSEECRQHIPAVLILRVTPKFIGTI